MAPVGGRSRCGYLSARLIFVCAVLHCITYTTSYSVHREEITLKVSHESEVGTLVLKSVFNSTCTEFSHIQRSASKPATLFVINNNADLVVSAPLQQHVGDLFILKPRPIPSCFNTAESVSKSLHVNIEITHSVHIITCVKPIFFGTVGRNAPPRTEIKGIDGLFACSLEAYSSNLDYRIVGSNHFYLETVNVRGQIMLQIFSRDSLQYSLENIHNFIITAENAKGLTGHTNIQIQILGIEFERDETFYYVPKGSHRVRRATHETRIIILLPENSVGTFFTITDPNVGNEPVNYTLRSSTLQNTFIVNSNGDVTLAPAARWDYERFVAENIPTQVTLTVEVKRISDGIVVRDIIQPVTITDVNDEKPVFTNKPVPFLATVNMQAASGTLVYTLTVMDPDAGASISLQDTTSDANTAIHFSVTVRAGNSVEIRTKDSGGFIPNTEYLVKVKATDTAATPTQETIATVRVKAGNREPQFGEPSYSVSFVEKNLAPQIIKAGLAVKSFQDNPVTFDVVEQDGQTTVSTLFRMEPNNNQSGQMRRGDQVVTTTMDYERDPELNRVYIRAREQRTGHSSSVNLTITLMDWNEFEPRFTLYIYQTPNAVREDIAVGSAVITVTATDQDKNTKLTFSVDDDHFRVESTLPDSTNNPHTATIYVAKALDYDRRQIKMYDFSVRALDSGTNPSALSGKASVRVTLLNLNDESPEFPPLMDAKIRFDANVGREVYTVRATDADTGDTVSYRFTTPNAYPNFELKTTSGRITVKQKFAETQEQITQFVYKLDVIATDDGQCCGGLTKKTSTGVVTVTILTDNFDHPSFPDCSTYDFSVQEDAQDVKVGTAKAVDQDFGINGEVKYSIRESNSKFRINETTGDIFTAVKINRETNPRETVNIIATDGGKLKGLCPLIIQINDINDNVPTFVQNKYTFSVLNTLSMDSVAMTVQARDNDIGKNAEIDYILLESPGGYFKLDTVGLKTGQIKVNGTLPTNTNGLPFDLLVQARDLGVPPQQSNVTVAVTLVENVSQLPPRWESTTAVFSVPENQGLGSTLTTLRALSQLNNSKILSFGIADITGDGYVPGYVPFRLEDTTAEGDVQVTQLKLSGALDYETTKQFIVTVRATIESYEITSPIFTIDSTTGWVYTKSEFDRETESQKIFTVKAVDGAPSSFNPPSHNTGSTLVLVTIEDVNDNAPYFPSNFTFYVKEDASIGHVVNQINAVDPDSAAILQYMLPSNLPFTIQSETAEIKVAGRLDYDLGQRVYNFKVTVDDSKLRSSADVTIYVENVNDNPPVVKSYTFLNLTENDQNVVNKVLVKIDVTDVDNTGDRFYYSLLFTDDIERQYFQINQNGEVIIVKALDRDFPNGKAQFLFTVEVGDADPNTGKPLYGYGTVTIRPIDVKNKPNVSVYPSTVALNKVPSRELTMTCSLTSTEQNFQVKDLLYLNIVRRSQREGNINGTGVVIASIPQKGQSPELGTVQDIVQRNPGLAGEMRQDGNRSIVTMTMTWNTSQIQCQDEGEFDCVFGYLDMSFASISTKGTATLSTSKYPEKVDMQYMNGFMQDVTDTTTITRDKFSIVEMSCTAHIGSDDFKTIDWYQTPRFRSPGNTDDLQKFNPTINDFLDPGKPSDTMTDCSYSLTSTLIYNITELDTGRTEPLQFECRVEYSLPGSNAIEVSKRITISVVNPDDGGKTDEVTSAGTPGIGTAVPESVNVAAVAGGTVVSVVIVIAALAAVVIILRRQGIRGKTAELQEREVNVRVTEQQGNRRPQLPDDVMATQSVGQTDEARNVYETINPDMRQEGPYEALKHEAGPMAAGQARNVDEKINPNMRQEAPYEALKPEAGNTAAGQASSTVDDDINEDTCTFETNVYEKIDPDMRHGAPYESLELEADYEQPVGKNYENV